MTVNNKDEFLVRYDEVLIVKRSMGSANVKLALDLEVEGDNVRVKKCESVGDLNEWRTDSWVDDRDKNWAPDTLFDANEK